MGTAPPHPVPPPDDAAELRFWQRTQRIGAGLTILTCAFVIAYLAMTWDEPNRPVMLAVALASTALSAALLRLPVARILKGRWRDVFFLSWSGGIIVAVAAFVALDGGTTESPLIALYFLPMIFATLAYPPLPMLTVAGAIVVAFVAEASVDGGDDAKIVVYSCALITAAIMCAGISQLHHRQRRELARVSRADPLTDCLNRRGFEERLDAELAAARRHEQSVSLLVVDLDGFKAVNDRDGHAAGDALLVWTVAQISASVRPLDAVGRLGGDEFAVVLPGVDGAEAGEVSQRVQRALALRIAASTGVATAPAEALDAAGLHARADARLYEAKRTRRLLSGTAAG